MPPAPSGLISIRGHVSSLRSFALITELLRASVFRAPERGVAGSGLSPFLAFWRSENRLASAQHGHLDTI